MKGLLPSQLLFAEDAEGLFAFLNLQAEVLIVGISGFQVLKLTVTNQHTSVPFLKEFAKESGHSIFRASQ